MMDNIDRILKIERSISTKILEWLIKEFEGDGANPDDPIQVKKVGNRVRSCVQENISGPFPEKIRNVAKALLAMGREIGKNDHSRVYLAEAEGGIVLDDAVRAVFGPDFVFPVMAPSYPLRRFLIVGESGTGKEGMARVISAALNVLSDSTDFISVNAASFSETLLESELFGHEKGAYTGAEKRRKGVISNLSEGGVLFLDEIGVASKGFQCQLLRVLESHSYRRVGGSEEETTRVHVIAATNLSQAQLREGNALRLDLYNRLASPVLHLPPLRILLKRDNEPLRFIRALVKREARILSGGGAGSERPESESNLVPNARWPSRGIARRIEIATKDYFWPGNLRELNNLIRQACIEGAERVPHLSRRILQDWDRDEECGDRSSDVGKLEKLEGGLAEELKRIESEYYELAASRDGATIQTVADQLGVNRQTATRRLKEFKLYRRFQRVE